MEAGYGGAGSLSQDFAGGITQVLDLHKGTERWAGACGAGWQQAWRRGLGNQPPFSAHSPHDCRPNASWGIDPALSALLRYDQATVHTTEPAVGLYGRLYEWVGDGKPGIHGGACFGPKPAVEFGVSDRSSGPNQPATPREDSLPVAFPLRHYVMASRCV
jgi:hypothetical protein